MTDPKEFEQERPLDAVLSAEEVAAKEAEHRRRAREGRRNLASVFKTVGQWEWLHGPIPEAKPLVTLPPAPGEKTGAPWMPRGKVAMLVAPGGTGKSQALIQLALCIACGSSRKWLGHFDIPPEARGPVVLALGEEGEADMQRRIRNVLGVLRYSEAEREAVASNLYAIPLAGRPSGLLDDPGRLMRTLTPEAAPDEIERAMLGYTEQATQWRKLLGEPPGRAKPLQWRAILIDPASRFIGPDAESDNAVATRFVEVLEEWALERWGGADVGPTVLMAHHTNKASGKERGALLGSQGAARGSSALTDGVRWQANMEAFESDDDRRGDVVGLKAVKVNDGAAGEAVYLHRLKHGVLTIDENQAEAKAVAYGERRQSSPAKPGADYLEDLR